MARIIEDKKMIESYDLHGTPIFTMLCIGEFTSAHGRANAVVDANVMRRSLLHLGLREYQPNIGYTRNISKKMAIKNLTGLAQSGELRRL